MALLPPEPGKSHSEMYQMPKSFEMSWKQHKRAADTLKKHEINLKTETSGKENVIHNVDASIPSTSKCRRRKRN